MKVVKMVPVADGLANVVSIKTGEIYTRRPIPEAEARELVAKVHRKLAAQRRAPKPTSQNAGYVSSLRTGAIGPDGKRGIVTLYDAEKQGIPASDGGRWAAVCELHGCICQTRNKSMGRHLIKVPWDWCEDCRAAAEGAGEVTYTKDGQYDGEISDYFRSIKGKAS